MLPDGHVTLDSILEGILDEESSSAIDEAVAAASSSASASSASPPSLSSPSSCGSPDQSGQGLAAVLASAAAGPGGGEDDDDVGGMGRMIHDPIPGIPCISIKTELPDSCSMDLMVSRGSGMDPAGTENCE